MLVQSNAAAKEIPVGIGTLAIRSRLGGISGWVAGRGLKALSAACCPEEMPIQCPTGSDSFCIGGDPTQPCDPTCGTSETITFWTGSGQGAGAGTQAYLDALAKANAAAVAAQAQAGGATGSTTGGQPPKPTGPNWGVIALIAAVGLVTIKVAGGGRGRRR